MVLLITCIPTDTRDSVCTDEMMEAAEDPRETDDPAWAAATAPPRFPPTESEAHSGGGVRH